MKKTANFICRKKSGLLLKKSDTLLCYFNHAITVELIFGAHLNKTYTKMSICTLNVHAEQGHLCSKCPQPVVIHQVTIRDECHFITVASQYKLYPNVYVRNQEGRRITTYQERLQLNKCIT